MLRVLLTHPPSAFERYFGDQALNELLQIANVERHLGEQPLRTADLVEKARDCQVILSDRATAGPAHLFAQLPELCAFVRCAVDIRTVDVDAASAHGVLVTRASAGFVNAVSEWIVGAMINLARRISHCTESYHRGVTPDAAMGVQLHGASIGIVGLGAIGTALARIAGHLGMEVLGHDPYLADPPCHVQMLEMNALLKRADFVVSLAIANDETENLFDAVAFAQMKTGAFFINASRGNLVDESALASALTSGHLAGAALDVGRAADQMPSPELAGNPLVIATPHIGGLTPAAVAHQALETVRQIGAIAQGKVPDGAVNAAAASRLDQLARND